LPINSAPKTWSRFAKKTALGSFWIATDRPGSVELEQFLGDAVRFGEIFSAKLGDAWDSFIQRELPFLAR
jgi:hypothetical protein